MKTFRLWIYTSQMKRMLFFLYPDAVQVSDEVYEIRDTPENFDGNQTYCGDMCGRTFSVSNG